MTDLLVVVVASVLSSLPALWLLPGERSTDGRHLRSTERAWSQASWLRR